MGEFMPNSDVQASADTPLWRKVWEFPLVAMVVGIIAMIVAISAVGALTELLPADLGRDTRTLIQGIGATIVIVAVYKFVIPRLGATRRDDLPLQGAVGDTALGLFVGFAVFSAIVGVAAALGIYRATAYGPSEDLVPLLIQAGLVASVLEEIIFRGILFRFIEQFAGSWAALIISSLLFGFGHASNDNATILSSLFITVEAGLLLGGAYMLTRNLWMAIGLHAGWNLTQGLIWGIPVSGNDFQGFLDSTLTGPEILTGGAFGLEASVIALVIASAAGIWMVWQAKKEGHVVPPSWAQ